MMSSRVLQHLPAIHRQRESVPGSEQYDDTTILALIHIESAGDEHAVSPSGRHYGILQCADAYVIDACEHMRVSTWPAKLLLGDPDLSVFVFLAHMQRYHTRHQYDPDRIALLHKAGAGSARDVSGWIYEGFSFDRAVKQLEARRPGLGRVSEYVRRFRVARKIYEVVG